MGNSLKIGIVAHKIIKDIRRTFIIRQIRAFINYINVIRRNFRIIIKGTLERFVIEPVALAFNWISLMAFIAVN